MFQGTDKIVRHLYFKALEDVDDESVEELIDHSFDLVYGRLTKKKREGLG